MYHAPISTEWLQVFPKNFTTETYICPERTSRDAGKCPSFMLSRMPFPARLILTDRLLAAVFRVLGVAAEAALCLLYSGARGVGQAHNRDRARVHTTRWCGGFRGVWAYSAKSLFTELSLLN